MLLKFISLTERHFDVLSKPWHRRLINLERQASLICTLYVTSGCKLNGKGVLFIIGLYGDGLCASSPEGISK